jgi:hypothetical protein
LIRTCPARISARARSRVVASPRSMRARHHPSRDRRKLTADVHPGDRLEGAIDAGLGAPARLVDAVQRRIGRLAGRGVLARGLAEDR